MEPQADILPPPLPMQQQPTAPFIPYAVPTAPARPTSLLVLAIVGIILGGMAVFGGIVAVVSFVVSRAYPSAMSGIQQSGWQLALAVVGLVVGAVQIWCCIGLIRMKPWARVAMIRCVCAYLVFLVFSTVVQVLVVVPQMVAMFNANLATANPAGGGGGAVPPVFNSAISMSMYFGAVIGLLVGAIYPTFVLVFMRRPNVLAAFEAAAAKGPQP
jgi:hypothetical protein